MPTAGNPGGPITTSCGTPRDSETIWRDLSFGRNPEEESQFEGKEVEEREKNWQKKEWKLFYVCFYYFFYRLEEERQ